MKKLKLLTTAAMISLSVFGGFSINADAAANRQVQVYTYKYNSGNCEQKQVDIQSVINNLKDCYPEYQGNTCLPNQQSNNCTTNKQSNNCTPETPQVNAVPETPPVNTVPEQPAETPAVPEAGKPEASVPESGSGRYEDMTYSEKVVYLVNEERAKYDLAPLTADESVTAAAQVRAEEIKSSFSHTRPNGTSFSTALKEQSVSYRGSGENIAWGQKTPEKVVEAWMNSSGHRANILNSKYTTIGVGYYQDASGTNYWAQLFTY